MKKEFFIGFLLPDAVADAIEELRGRISGPTPGKFRIPTAPCHITLKAPFEDESVSARELLELMHSRSTQTPTITIKAMEAKILQSGSPLVIGWQPNPILNQLQSELARAIKQRYGRNALSQWDNAWHTPHTTIIKPARSSDSSHLDAIDDAKRLVDAELQRNPVLQKIHLDQIALFTCADSSTWAVYDTVPLATPAAHQTQS